MQFTQGVDRTDLVGSLSMIVLYPRAAQTLNRLLSADRGPATDHLSELLLIGDSLSLLHSLDPNLQIAGPGLESLADKYLDLGPDGPRAVRKRQCPCLRCDLGPGGPSAVVSMVSELSAALEHLEAVQAAVVVSPRS
jgi:hypothetical protein